MTDQHPLSVERFGPVRALQRERFQPVPAYRPGLCKQGPSVLLMEAPAVLAAYALVARHRANRRGAAA